MFLPRKDGWEALAALCLLTMPTPIKRRCVCVCIVIPHWRGAGALVCALAPLREWPQPLAFRSTRASKGFQQREEGLTEKGQAARCWWVWPGSHCLMGREEVGLHGWGGWGGGFAAPSGAELAASDLRP